MNTCKGYMLLELMIAMSITILATFVITRFFLAEHYIHLTQETEAEMQQTLRGALQIMNRELMLTGYGLHPESNGITEFKEDELEFRTNLKDIKSFLTISASNGDTTLHITSGTGSSFDKNDVIIICNKNNPDECEEHTLSANGTTNLLKITSGLGSTFQAGSRIDLINIISYRYNKSKRALQRKIDKGWWEPIAENIAENGLIITYRDKDNNQPAKSSAIRSLNISLTVEGFRRDIYLQENNGYRRRNAISYITLRNYI